MSRRGAGARGDRWRPGPETLMCRGHLRSEAVPIPVLGEAVHLLPTEWLGAGVVARGASGAGGSVCLRQIDYGLLKDAERVHQVNRNVCAAPEWLRKHSGAQPVPGLPPKSPQFPSGGIRLRAGRADKFFDVGRVPKLSRLVKSLALDVEGRSRPIRKKGNTRPFDQAITGSGFPKPRVASSKILREIVWTFNASHGFDPPTVRH